MFCKILLIVAICCVSRFESVTSTFVSLSSSIIDDCFPVKDDSNSLICRSVPKCSEYTNKLYRQFKTIIFDLENRYYLNSRQFYNCTFDWSLSINLHFKNIRKLSSYSFDSIIVAPNTIVNVKLDGAGLNLDKQSSASKLLINRNAFNNLVLKKGAKFNLFVKNYEGVFVRDTLVENSLWQTQNSEINLNLNNIELVWFKNKKDTLALEKEFAFGDATSELELSDEKPVNLNDNYQYQSNNISYSLLVNNVNNLMFDSFVYANLQVNSYSDFNLFIKMVKNVFFDVNLFDSLMLGYYARFNFIVENCNKLAMSKELFAALQLEQYSVFFFHLDQLGAKYMNKPRNAVKTVKRDTNVDYYDAAANSEQVINVFDDGYYDPANYQDYEYDESTRDSTVTATDYYTSWLCLPESLFKNVRLAETSLVQTHFTQIDLSISVSSDAFREIQLAESSKFQIMFQDIKGNIIFDRDAVNMIKLTAGLFEIWVDNHRQKVDARGNANINDTASQTRAQFNPKHRLNNNNKQTLKNNSIKTINSAKSNFLKFMDFSVNKIYLNARSNFRIGFLNSDSVLLLNGRSIRNFHEDRFGTDTNTDYRTKLELDLNGSENVLVDYLTIDDDDDDDDSSGNWPKLIEIDGYRPMMSLIRADRSIELVPGPFVEHSSSASSSSSSSSSVQIDKKNQIKKRLLSKSDTYLQSEFCRFYKLRPFMTWLPVKTSKSDKHSRLRNNLIYFSQTSINEFNLHDDVNNQTARMCTSCLYIFLYRTVHRRIDFFYVKTHLPKCFINLHFKSEESLELLNIPEENDQRAKLKRDKYVKSIEESFRIYWRLLDCNKLTGLNNVLNYDGELNKSDETRADYELLDAKCTETNAANSADIKLVTAINPDDWHDNEQAMCAKISAESRLNRTELNLKRAGKKLVDAGRNRAAVGNHSSSRLVSFKFTFLVVALFSFIIVIIIYVKYNRPKKPCIKINLKRGLKNSFQRLENNSGNHVRYQSSSNQTTKAKRANDEDVDDDEMDANQEHSGDELNGYEYDDEFEMDGAGGGEQQVKNHHHNDNYSSSNENVELRIVDPSAVGTGSSFKQKSLQKIRRIFNGARDTNLLLKTGANSANKYPAYSYNSTDSTLVRTQIPNEFELKLKNDNDDDDGEMTSRPVKSASLVTYDPKRQNATPNLVRLINDHDDEQPVSDYARDRIIRLATNPLDRIDSCIEEERQAIKNKLLNETNA